MMITKHGCMKVQQIVDIDVMTKDCKYWESKEDETGYENWLSTQKCPINHEGSSGSMETEGAVRIFNNSIEKTVYGMLTTLVMGTPQL